MERIECINYDCIDPNDKDPHYYIIRYIEGSYAVYSEYRDFSEADALDAFADYSRDAYPGYTPDDARIEELRADAIADGYVDRGNGEDETYIEDFYVRAGNDSAWLETPEIIERVTLDEIDRREWVIVPPKK